MTQDRLFKTERYDILKKYNWRCANCGIRVKFSKKHKIGERVAHIDHIYPQSKSDSYSGYIGEIKNLQVLCSRCNLMKSDKPPYYCPNCYNPVEMATFNVSEKWEDYDPDDAELIWICNICDCFFKEVECLKLKI